MNIPDEFKPVIQRYKESLIQMSFEELVKYLDDTMEGLHIDLEDYTNQELTGRGTELILAWKALNKENDARIIAQKKLMMQIMLVFLNTLVAVTMEKLK